MKLSISFILETLKNSIGAIPVTLKLTFVPFLIAAPIAFFLALAQVNKVRFWSRFSAGYVSLIRGTPAVVLVLLLYNTLPVRLSCFFKATGSSFNVYSSVQPIVYAYVIFTITAIAPLIEILRSAIASVNRGQLEAAYTIGMSAPQAYIRIILPQALVAAMPNLGNLIVALVKNTSLAFMMTVKDITQTAKLGAALNYKYTEAYIVILLLYVVICLVLEQICKLIERYLSRYKGFRTA
ncbi:MAG: amino acid ABC transporter permease [Lachnospiraceae bacterium]|nr:amino acid ABC transporter permease [Lachnospiraceae bacterium]MBP3608929.1 amino acid ABC transporter permease [Lachnospiraceae bacterium]